MMTFLDRRMRKPIMGWVLYLSMFLGVLSLSVRAAATAEINVEQEYAARIFESRAAKRIADKLPSQLRSAGTDFPFLAKDEGGFYPPMQGGTAEAFADAAMAGLLMCKRVESTEIVTSHGREHVPAAGGAAAEQPSRSSSASASPFSVYTPMGKRSNGPMIRYQYWKTRVEWTTEGLPREDRSVFLALRDQHAILSGALIEKKVHYGPIPGVHLWPTEEGRVDDADDKLACAIPLAWARENVASVPLMQDAMMQLQHNGAADTQAYGSQENWLDLFNVLLPKYMWFRSHKFEGRWEAPIMDVREKAHKCARDRGRFLQTCKAAVNVGVPTTKISVLVNAGLTDLIGQEVPEHCLNVVHLKWDLKQEPRSCYFQGVDESDRNLPGRGRWDVGRGPQLQQHWLPFFRPLFGPARVLRANGATVWEGLYPSTLVSELGPSGSSGSETAGATASDF